MAAVKIQDLTYCYPESSRPALQKINLEVAPGEFLIITGESGCGKSTLLRAISGLAPGFYGGSCSGGIYIDGIDNRQMDRRELAGKVGMVFQSPENQLVMMHVEDEIVFGLENQGVPNHIMKRRLMEVSAALGISPFLHSFIPDLSGGQKQKVVLAAILAMQPGIILLDEPTSQLDPVAAEEFLNVVRNLNEDQGITIILIEQRLERCCQLANRIVFMDKGQIAGEYDSRKKADLQAMNQFSQFLPPVPRMFGAAGFTRLPLTVKEGREILNSFTRIPRVEEIPVNSLESCRHEVNQPAVKMHELSFTYRDGHEALKKINLTVNEGDFIAVMGENGAGKTTLLKHMNGLLKPGRGRVEIFNRDSKNLPLEELARDIAYLAQDPGDTLFLPSVQEELQFTLKSRGLDTSMDEKEEFVRKMGLSELLTSAPRDLSCGERQRAALASILISNPRLLLLDEPTRGLEYRMKESLGSLLGQLNREGLTIVMVTHDVEFAAEYAGNVVLMFDGRIIAQGSKHEVLNGSLYYSPQVNKLFNNIVDNLITVDEGKETLLEFMEANREKKIYSV